jgi:uncharacterized protein
MNHSLRLSTAMVFIASLSIVGCESNPSRINQNTSMTTEGRTITPRSEPARAQADSAYASGDDAGALALYLPIAQAGDAAIQARVAYLYKRNRGVPVNESESCNWYEKAATGNVQDGTSAVNLGICFENGSGRAKSMTDAVRWYRTSAERNNPFGMYNLGLAIEYGAGVKQDYAQAAHWFQRAIDAKLPASDSVDARRHLKRSLNHVGAARGDPQALYDLAIDLFSGHAPEVKDTKRAMSAMRDAAMKGALPDAWFVYGSWVHMGIGGVASDLAQAATWIKKAADTGHEDAGLRYANILLCGIGTRKDQAAAERQLQQMINAGKWRAMSELSEWHARGDCGFRKDEALSKTLRVRADAAQRSAVR